MPNHLGNARVRPVTRRWRVPPPIIQDGSAPGPEGLSVLQEERGELGVVLWKSLRSVLLWSDTEPVLRRNLRDEESADRRQSEILAAIPPSEDGVRRALEDLLPVLHRPEFTEPEFTALACSRIARWAEARGQLRTALEFHQAAALCCPGDPQLALAVGRTARDLAQYPRAEAWLHRAIGLSRQATDWESYVRSYLQHGVMLMRRGALPAARRSMLKALRRSRRQGLRKPEAWSLHDLFVLESTSGRSTHALNYAREAVAMAPANAEDLPRLAHDIAYFWLQAGNFRHALPVFMATLPRVPISARPTVLGSIARAAAGAGDPGVFRWAEEQLVSAAEGPGVAEAWVEVARGAILMGELERADRAAGYAESVARARREGRIRFLAEAVLEEARAEAQAARAASVERHPAPPSQSDDLLARDILRALEGSAFEGRALAEAVS